MLLALKVPFWNFPILTLRSKSPSDIYEGEKAAAETD
jgi:hypothetical protein